MQNALEFIYRKYRILRACLVVSLMMNAFLFYAAWPRPKPKQELAPVGVYWGMYPCDKKPKNPYTHFHSIGEIPFVMSIGNGDCFYFEAATVKP